MTDRMFKPVKIIFLAIVLLFGAAWMARAFWIRDKIAALSAPPSTAYAAANAVLPPKGSRARIVLIGDSRIAQWPATAVWPETWEVINRGIGGETAVQLSLRFPADAIALDPDVIVIEGGINDLVAASFMDEDAQRAFLNDTVAILRRLADQAAASRRRALIATIIPPAEPDLLRLPVWRESLRDLVTAANAGLAKSELPGGAAVIDLASLLAPDGKTVSDIYRADTLHFNDTGYARLTAALIERVQSVLEAKRP